ncbi:ADP-ribosylation factor-binding protein Gga [Rhodnius prolixus]
MASQLDIITTSLEALIQRATSVSNQGPDTAAIDAFCGLINREPECAQTAAKFITAKVHSLQEWEALQALLVLETCMKRCGSVFHAEVGKFRFLNELIKLVSPKYLGAHTPEPVRRRVLELMYTWTIQYPRESKIKEAYEMLKKQGVVKEEPPVIKEVNTSRQQPSILQDEEKSQLLQKLLQSKNPQDLQAANRLIKSMVKEEERRVEEKWRLTVELATVVNNCRLLNEMLDSYQEGVTNDQELELIKELHSTCHSLRPVLFKLANSNTEADFCHDVLTANDELGEVFTRYNQLIDGGSQSISRNANSLSQPKPKEITSLLDLTPSPSKESIIESTPGHLDQLSQIGLDLSAPVQANDHNTFTSDNLSVLTDVFSDIKITSSNVNSPKPHVPNYLPLLGDNNIAGTLQTLQTSSKAHGPFNQQNKEPIKSKGLEELDILGKTLLKESLSSSKPNALIKPEELPPPKPSSSSTSSDVEGLLSLIDDDVLLTCNTQVTSDVTSHHEPSNTSESSPAPSLPETSVPVTNSQPSRFPDLLPLGDITVTLQDVKPSTVPPFQALNERNGVSTAIHLAKDCPRPDVAVFVLTTSSKNQFPISNFLFQPVVPKSCRLRLLAPSSTTLPAHNPFLPPSAITQIMLIASPNKDPIKLKYVVSYTMDDETITEMGEIEELLLAEK